MTRIKDACAVSAVVFVWIILLALGLGAPVIAALLTGWGLTNIGVSPELALIMSFPVGVSVLVGIIVAFTDDEDDPL